MNVSMIIIEALWAITSEKPGFRVLNKHEMKEISEKNH
jgi:hypothetical protein